MHVLPQLRRLEMSHPDELVVIGVHSGKFWAERITENIRQAVLRLDVEHPVVNDRFFRTWRSYAISAWPTVVLIDPEGYIVDIHPGEVFADDYLPIVSSIIDEFARRGTLSRRPMQFEPEAAAEPPRPLAFPGSVLADGHGRIFIADSAHNRIVVASLRTDGTSATTTMIIGNGQAGLTDGDFQSATFNRPRGMALLGNVLYVADTENHALRSVDLGDQTVSTIAGTGDEARGPRLVGLGSQVPLSSPWDIAIHGRGLYIAMAGTHQIWRLDLGTNEVHPYAGTGAESLVDGERTAAVLAQPSALAIEDERMYFADSESSAIRWVQLPPGNEVNTVVGTGLFDFGDEDGSAERARLQHPQGVAWHDGIVYVADTYNNKIKAIDPTTRMARTFLGSAQAGLRDGSDPLFYEPSGISASDGLLYVADTNNHVIRAIDLDGRMATTLQIDGLEAI